jgi:hypothetical protein
MMMAFIAEHWTGVLTIITSLLAFGSSVTNRKKIHQVHHLFNGRLTDFLAAERKLAEQALEQARAEGYAKGVADNEAKHVDKLIKIIEKKDEGNK